jgi:hypothetical protein
MLSAPAGIPGVGIDGGTYRCAVGTVSLSFGGALKAGGWTTSMFVGMGVLLRVVRWWMRGVARSISGSVGLSDDDMQSTL